MAVDTRNKRASLVSFALPFGRVFPAPDGTIATADRKHIGYSYPGIAVGAPPPSSGALIRKARGKLYFPGSRHRGKL